MIDISNERKGAFATALANAAKGDKIIYWVGEHCGGQHKADAMLAEANGAVALVQKRDGGLFQYIAQVRK